MDGHNSVQIDELASGFDDFDFKRESHAFGDSFSHVMEHLALEIKSHRVPESFKLHLEKMFKYNLIGGKMIRGCLVALTYKTLMGKGIKEEEVRNSRLLGWCVEILQGLFLVLDDIMDSSTTRRGKLCWYKLDDVGLTSINDSVICNALLYRIIVKNFKDKPYCTKLLELFFEVILCTGIGQGVDITTTIKNIPQFSEFSIDRYDYIVEYKTSYYSFYLPVALGMIMSGISSNHVFNDLKEVLVEIGKYYQIQDDYIDCYGNPEETGKIGTDICDNKCTWLIVKALERCSDDQRKILSDNYGKNDQNCVNVVIDIYNKLDIKKAYELEEERRISHIFNIIKNFKHGEPLKKLLIIIMKIIHHRSS